MGTSTRVRLLRVAGADRGALAGVEADLGAAAAAGGRVLTARPPAGVPEQQ